MTLWLMRIYVMLIVVYILFLVVVAGVHTFCDCLT